MEFQDHFYTSHRDRLFGTSAFTLYNHKNAVQPKPEDTACYRGKG